MMAAQAAFQIAGFACLTVASAWGAAALLGAGQGRGARVLPWTRAGFLFLGGALAAGALESWRAWGQLWPRSPRDHWGLVAWLIVFAVLHVHRIKAWQGRPALRAGLAGWALALAACFLLR
jgi:hypothetical protein